VSLNLPAGVQVNAPIHPRFDEILTHDALALVAKLHRAFEPRRQELLEKARVERQARIDAGEMPDFLPETKHIREGDWKIAPLPKALERRRTEITGPVERKMIINAYNSGADSYMTDFEDSNSPNWYNQIQGQVNLVDAIRRKLSFVNEVGKEYKLNDRIATLQIRPRGWHLGRETCDWSMASASPVAFSISVWCSSTTPRSRSRAAPARSITCRRWRAISKRGCGTTSS
jgi:malate synthase